MKTALIPGSFDPVTLGHIDMFRRAASMFGKVIIAVCENPDKTPRFSAEERMELIRSSWHAPEGTEIVHCETLVAEFVREKGADFIVKGVRNARDYEYERENYLVNLSLSGVDTVLLPAPPELVHVASSTAMQLYALGADVSGFLPAEVIKKLDEKHNK